MTGTSKKAACTIITTCIVSTLIVLSCVIALPLLLRRPVHTTNPTTHGSDLIKLDSSVASVTITLLEPEEAQINALLTTNKPTEYRILSEESSWSRNQLNGPFPYPYNYRGGDNPIYLFAGSKLIYIMFVTGTTTSTCPAQLYLFKNQQAYDNFKNGHLNLYKKSSCVFPAPDKQTRSFEINVTATYYVGIYIANNTTVVGYGSVERVFYNTTEFNKQNYCSEKLSINNRNCKVTICNIAPACSNQYYLLVNSTHNITYTIMEEQFFSNIEGQIITLSAASIFLVAVLTISTLLICISAYKLIRNSSDESIEEKTNSIVLLSLEENKEFVQYRDTSKYIIDIPTLMNLVVAEIPGEWENVGTQLGIKPDQLDGIKKNTSYGGDPKNFFRAVLEKWEASQTQFNWCTMLTILSSPIINQENLAHKIAIKFRDKTTLIKQKNQVYLSNQTKWFL